MRVDKILYRLMACDVAESLLPLYGLAYAVMRDVVDPVD